MNERLLLSSIMLLGSVPGSLRAMETDFSDPRCAVVFRCMVVLCTRGEALDVASLAGELETRESLQLVGGLQGLADLCMMGGATSHVTHYDAIVARAAERRRIASLARDVTQAACEGDEQGLLSAYSRLVHEWENQQLDPI